MPSACCCTVSPITWSTYFASNCHRRCAPRKSKLCALSCSRSVRESVKPLVVSAFTWPAAGLSKISSKPPRFATPPNYPNCSTTHSRKGQAELSLKTIREIKKRLANRYEHRQPGRKPVPRQQWALCITISGPDELTRLGLRDSRPTRLPEGPFELNLRKRPNILCSESVRVMAPLRRSAPLSYRVLLASVSKRWFYHAKRMGYSVENPVVGGAMFRPALDAMLVLTFDEQRSYLAEASQPLHDIAEIMLDTGMRPEEVFRITIENIDFEKKLFSIPSERPRLPGEQYR